MLAAVTGAAVPRLPTGVCHADSGGFQLAAATLGITHPPGYAGYVTIWHLITRIVPADPAYVVSISCLMAGLGVLTLLVCVQTRLGLNAWMACAVALLLAAHPRVWSNLLAPEVYMISLGLVAASAWLLIRYADFGRRGDLFAAALLYGLATANRIPALLLLPLILAAWWIARRRWERGAAAAARTLALCAALAAIPMLYNFAYLWVRDRPDLPYNYLEQFNADTGLLPHSTDGWHAKWRRVLWLQGGEQFRDLLVWSPPAVETPDPHEVPTASLRSKFRWIVQDVFPDPLVSLGLLWMVVAILACTARRRFRTLSLVLTALALTVGGLLPAGQWIPALADSPLTYHLLAAKPWIDGGLLILLGSILTIVLIEHRIVGILLLGMAAGSIAFVLMYRIYGLAADLLPLLFVLAVLIGRMLAAVFPRHGPSSRTLAAALIMLSMIAGTLVQAPQRRSLGRDEDAADFLTQVDLASLPPNAVICTGWGMATPLWYAALVQTPRPDISIVNAPVTEWPRMTRDLMHRPIYLTDDPAATTFPSETSWRRERNLWRLETAAP